jgi:alpha-galactosidase
LIGDILSYPELQDATISLFDIDPNRLRTSEIVADKIADFFGITPHIEATLDRRQSLAGGFCDQHVSGRRLQTCHRRRF